MTVNLLPNPGFDVDATGWLRQSSTTATIARDTIQQRSGAGCGAWSTTAATYLSTDTTAVPATPGRVYTARAWVRGGGTCALGVMFLDAAQAVIGSTSTSADVAMPGTWVQLVAPAPTAPAGTAYVRLRLYQRSATAQTVYVDDAELYQVPQLAATVLPEYAAVRLVVTGADNGPLVITRTDANGVAPVRLGAGAVVSAGLLTVVDYEPALVGPVSYVADSASATVELPQRSPRLSVVGRPAAARDVVELTAYSESSDGAPFLARVYLRGDALPITSPLSLRQGPFTLHTDTYAEAQALRELARAGQVLQLRQPTFPGLDLYLVPSRVSVATVNEALTPAQWRVTFDYVEVSWPSSTLLPLAAGAVWTYADLKALGGTYTQLKATWSNYFALAIGGGQA